MPHDAPSDFGPILRGTESSIGTNEVLIRNCTEPLP
jgi:hypothetical protein